MRDWLKESRSYSNSSKGNLIVDISDLNFLKSLNIFFNLINPRCLIFSLSRRNLSRMRSSKSSKKNSSPKKSAEKVLIPFSFTTKFSLVKQNKLVNNYNKRIENFVVHVIYWPENDIYLLCIDGREASYNTRRGSHRLQNSWGRSCSVYRSCEYKD